MLARQASWGAARYCPCEGHAVRYCCPLRHSPLPRDVQACSMACPPRFQSYTLLRYAGEAMCVLVCVGDTEGVLVCVGEGVKEGEREGDTLAV